MHTFSVIEQLYILKHILFYLFHCNISSTIDSLFFMVAKKLSAHELLYGHLSLLILANILFSSTSDDIHKFYDFLQTPSLSFLFLVCPITFQRSPKPAFFLITIKNPCNIAEIQLYHKGFLSKNIIIIYTYSINFSMTTTIPSLSLDLVMKSADSFTFSWAFAMATPTPAYSIMLISLYPSPQQMVFSR